MEKIPIGIDLGDNCFRICYLKDKIPQVLSDSMGNMSFPSKVSFQQNGKCFVGHDAELFGAPENTVMHQITIAGLPFSELEKLNDQHVYQFCSDRNGSYIDAHRVYPRVNDFLVEIFKFISNLVKERLNKEIEFAVIAIPDGSHNPKRIAIRDAAELAGISVRQLVNQTIAAGLGFNLHRLSEFPRRNIAVIDIGASHSSMTIIECYEKKVAANEIAHCRIGTNIFQRRLAQFIAEKHKQESGYDILANDQYGFFWQSLLIEAGFALVDLSTNSNITVAVGGIGINGSRVIVDVSRDEFNSLISDDLQEIRNTIKCYRNAPGTICAVYVVGGGSAIPVIQEMVSQIYDNIATRVDYSDPSAAVLGSAIKAGIYSGVIDANVVEITAFDLGTFYRNYEMDVLISKGATIPHKSYPKRYGIHGHYTEKVYQWIGEGTGQDKSEDEPDVIVLCNQDLFIWGDAVTNQFIIDESGIVTFVVVDLGKNIEYILDNYNVDSVE